MSNSSRQDELSQSEPRSAVVLGGKYLLGRVIGSGGMGTVYEASHVALGTPFAVKLLSSRCEDEPSAVARFHREAKLASAVIHDNICPVLDYGLTEDGAPYLVMPLLRGEPLSRVFASRPIRAGRVLDIIGQTLDALQAAHDRNIIHRDLKPENIFVTKVGDRADFVKLLDFGVSKMLGGQRDSQPPVTQTGAVPGTPSYMSPEQARGLEDYDHRVDIYSMGVVLYEAVTGRKPFEATSYNNLLFRIASDPFPAPCALCPELPPELENVILKAMSRDPSERFDSARRMREALDDLAARPTVQALELYGQSPNDDSGATEGTQSAETVPHTPSVRVKYPALATAPKVGRKRALVFAGGIVFASVFAVAVFEQAGVPQSISSPARACGTTWTKAVRRISLSVHEDLSAVLFHLASFVSPSVPANPQPVEPVSHKPRVRPQGSEAIQPSDVIVDDNGIAIVPELVPPR